MTRTRLRRLSSAGIVAATALIAVTTLTPLATSDGGCALGLPCVVVRAGGFGALGVAIAARFAVSEAAARAPRRMLLMTLLALWIGAAIDELAQAAVGRDPALANWLADMAGAIGGLTAGSIVLRALRQQRPQHD
ncbi:MAG: hypothetical protein EXR65_04780 [Dehalococcoidia bacterium]|nr:hypothetical protein [Dehalococcoidia bacterium]